MMSMMIPLKIDEPPPLERRRQNDDNNSDAEHGFQSASPDRSPPWHSGVATSRRTSDADAAGHPPANSTSLLT